MDNFNGADVITCPPGRWCVSNGTAGGESGAWYVEVIEFDAAYRTVTAHPYIGLKKYYYFAKMDHGVWQGWEKYPDGTNMFDPLHTYKFSWDAGQLYVTVDGIRFAIAITAV